MSSFFRFFSPRGTRSNAEQNTEQTKDILPNHQYHHHHHIVCCFDLDFLRCIILSQVKTIFPFVPPKKNSTKIIR